MRAIKEVSHDPTCRKEVSLDDGRQRTAVQLQSEYLEMALAYYSSRDIDPVDKDVIWASGSTPWRPWRAIRVELDDKIDWIMKRSLIEGFMERKKLDWGASQVEMLDLQYHDLRPDKGLYYVLVRQGRAERIVTDEEIVSAVHVPPEDTRAYFRGECIKKYGPAVFGVNWDSISFGVEGEPIKRILMAEPLKGTRTHVEDLLANSPQAADLVKNLRA